MPENDIFGAKHLMWKMKGSLINYQLFETSFDNWFITVFSPGNISNHCFNKFSLCCIFVAKLYLCCYVVFSHFCISKNICSKLFPKHISIFLWVVTFIVVFILVITVIVALFIIVVIIIISLLQDNLFEWHFTVRGPGDTDFQVLHNLQN